MEWADDRRWQLVVRAAIGACVSWGVIAFIVERLL